MTDHEATPETLKEEADVLDRMQLVRMRDVIDAAADAWQGSIDFGHLQHLETLRLVGIVREQGKRLEEAEKELDAVLDVAIARGEELGFIYADDDYRERLAGLKETP